MDRWVPWISASVAPCTSGCMQQLAPLLNPSSFRAACTPSPAGPSPCFLRGCHADARHDSKLFLDDLSIPAAPRLAEVLSLSRTRTPHAVGSAASVFIDSHMIRTRRHFFISRQFFPSTRTPFVLCGEGAQQVPHAGSLISRRRNMIRIMHAAVS
jgi:hypothetical protein